MRYYFKNLFWGLLPAAVMISAWFTKPAADNKVIITTFILVSGFLYPIARLYVEKIALTYTTKKFWAQDVFTNPIGGSLQAILFAFCFIFSIPLSLGFIISRMIKPLT